MKTKRYVSTKDGSRSSYSWRLNDANYLADILTVPNVRPMMLPKVRGHQERREKAFLRCSKKKSLKPGYAFVLYLLLRGKKETGKDPGIVIEDKRRRCLSLTKYKKGQGNRKEENNPTTRFLLFSYTMRLRGKRTGWQISRKEHNGKEAERNCALVLTYPTFSPIFRLSPFLCYLFSFVSPSSRQSSLSKIVDIPCCTGDTNFCAVSQRGSERNAIGHYGPTDTANKRTRMHCSDSFLVRIVYRCWSFVYAPYELKIKLSEVNHYLVGICFLYQATKFKRCQTAFDMNKPHHMYPRISVFRHLRHLWKIWNARLKSRFLFVQDAVHLPYKTCLP